MDRVIEEMAKAKADVEKRYREKIPEIIRECMAFAYLGKMFTFDANEELEKKVNKKFIELSDNILADIESRARNAIKYADEEEDESTILAYINREINGEDLITRIDKHNSNFRYFLEGWVAIGMVNGFSENDLLSNIMTFMHNVYVSDQWQKAFNEGYRSNAIRTRGYSFGKGILRNPITALSEVEKHSINEAFQFGRFLRFRHDGAIGYTIHRGSTFDCPHCDSFTGIIHPLDVSLLPLHVRCVCYSKPFMKGEEFDGFIVNDLTLFRRNLQEYNRLINDVNYKNVSQGKINAAVKATHLRHNDRGNGELYFGKEKLTSAKLEQECQEELVRMGRSCVLAEEGIQIAKGKTITALDTYTDWVRADIRSITENNEHTITNAIRAKSRKIAKFNNLYPSETTETLILFFHDPSFFDKNHIINSWYRAGYDRGKPIENKVKRLLCVVKGYSDVVEMRFK